MKPKLRPYQSESIELLRQSFANGNQRIILCLPTGAGKTVVFSEMVKLAADRGTQTLVLTDRIELFKQTFKAINTHDVEIQTLNAKSGKWFDHTALVTVAMVETAKRRMLMGYEPDLIIIDEMHKGSFTKLIDLYPNSKVIGATATPIGKHIPKYYHDIVQTIDIPDLIEQDFLSDCIAYQMQDDFSDLEVKRGEYTEKSLFSHFNDRKLYGGVVDKWIEKAKDKKTLVFNVNIEHAEAMHQEFLEAGIKSEVLTSKTPEYERNQILSAFSDGYFPVLNNCGILTTGYDEPSIECIVMNRKTKSLPLWLQCCGRGSRIYPGKENFIILDFGMNHTEHGLWNEPRKWSVKEKKRKKKEGAAPVKECPKCFAMVYASARICQHCEHKFEIVEEQPTEGVMVEVTPQAPEELKGKRISQLSVEELLKLEQSKKYKASFIWRILRSQGEEALKEYADIKGYKNGWLYRQIQDLQNSNFNDYVIR